MNETNFRICATAVTYDRAEALAFSDGGYAVVDFNTEAEVANPMWGAC